MIKGYIDRITSSGYIEGWAFDSDSPLQPLTIAVLDQRDKEIAWGLAHRYRGDLATAGCAAGWCAFRVRAHASVERLRRQPLKLIERGAGIEIQLRFPVPYAKDFEPVLSTMPVIVASDPTMTLSIVQLAGCEGVFAHYIAAHGVDAFVRAAYIYVLGRPADAGGLTAYSGAIGAKRLTPFQLLATLGESAEFRTRRRVLAAPNSSGFPFR